MRREKNEMKKTHWFILAVALIVVYMVLKNLGGVSKWISGYQERGRRAVVQGR